MLQIKRNDKLLFALRLGYCSPNPPDPLSPEERGKIRGLPPLVTLWGYRPNPRLYRRLRAIYHLVLIIIISVGASIRRPPPKGAVRRTAAVFKIFDFKNNGKLGLNATRSNNNLSLIKKQAAFKPLVQSFQLSYVFVVADFNNVDIHVLQSPFTGIVVVILAVTHI